MPWVKLSDDYYEDPRFGDVPPLAELLWVRGLAWCNRNGERVLTRRAVAALSADMDCPPEALTAHLVACGSWIEHPPGWVIHNYEKYQGVAVQLSEQRRAAGAKGGKASAEKRRSTQAHEASATANGQQEPQPDTRYPVPNTTTTVSPAGREDAVAAALEVLFEREWATVPAGVARNRDTYRAGIKQRIRRDHAAELHRLAHDHPDWAPKQLAAAIAPPTPPTASVPEGPLPPTLPDARDVVVGDVPKPPREAVDAAKALALASLAAAKATT